MLPSGTSCPTVRRICHSSTLLICVIRSWMVKSAKQHRSRVSRRRRLINRWPCDPRSKNGDAVFVSQEQQCDPTPEDRHHIGGLPRQIAHGAGGRIPSAGRCRRPRTRVMSDCHFRKTATEYDRKPGTKSDTALPRTRLRLAQQRQEARPCRLRRRGRRGRPRLGLGLHAVRLRRGPVVELLHERDAHCPRRKPPFLAVKRPARPYKGPIQNGF
jgi:hypothetical protein